ncbi:hypothetical protein ACWDWO_20215 [Actinopolymorpha singaporensis]|uniref:Lipopolysaccharide assembly protein A domain-containing protein n=1 Tax=Actinopolymorpha singaporensis TaxID=117157 RepID=A0A1H1LAC4_9ACTN|nr:hypothetical protein [Actinopolymorpha singaporensis]SDR70809.1 hypothetical protein SAMN04489717_0185 [Actinopolymorpha singaporensis]
MNSTQTDQERQGFWARPSVRRAAKFAVVALIALVFIFENTAITTVRLLVPEVTMPLWGALLIAWVLGLLAGTLSIRRRR